jgi:hypothetical protein
MKTLNIILFCVLLVGCGLSPEQLTGTAIVAQTQTQKAAPTPTFTPSPNLTETQIAIPTSTPTQAFNADVIFTAFAKPTVTALARAQAIFDEIQAAAFTANELDLSEAKLVYGPKDDSLTHTINNKVMVDNAGLVLKNFVCTIRFINPYDTSTTGKWDYGVLFRNKYRNDQYRLGFLSNQSWTLRNEEIDTYIYSSNDKNIKAKAGEENTIWLIVIDTKAYLFINGIYTIALDIGTSPAEGDISPATGLYYGNLTKKRITEYKDFTVWSLP